MTVRITEPQIDDTNRLLYQVLEVALKGERVLFLCEAGTAVAVVQRLRMQLSRQRNKMRQKGKRIQEFQLHSEIYPETHGGIRYDAVVMWRVLAKWQQAELEIEELLGLNGAQAA